MRFKLGGMGLALARLLASATAPRADAVDKDLKALEGEWIIKNEAGAEISCKFKGDKLEVTAPSRSYKMTVKIDPAAKPEKTVDFHIDKRLEDAKGKTSKGIYKLEDDNNTFVFCMRPEGDRPDKYEQIGYEQIVSKLKRKKS